jgi:hypothetical protein
LPVVPRELLRFVRRWFLGASWILMVYGNHKRTIVSLGSTRREDLLITR